MNERMLRGVSYRRREGEPMRRRAFARALLGCAMVGCLGCGASGAHAQEGAYEMTYEGGESEIIAAGSALFSQAENGLPGDTFTGYASIENESGGPCEFFTAMRDVVADGPEDMLERIAFTVVADGDSVIFDGSLSDAAGAEPISLGVVDPGENRQVEYAVIIPPELTSEYADASVGLNVAVSAREQPLTVTSAAKEPATGAAALGKTGDEARWILGASVGVGLLALGGYAMLGGRMGMRRR